MYKTPGVYIKDVTPPRPLDPQFDTAVPAFIGYTAKALDADGNSLHLLPVAIRDLGEFEQLFGGPFLPRAYQVVLDTQRNNAVNSVTVNDRFYLYDSLHQYFDNGGGRCFIVSVGSFAEGLRPTLTPPPVLEDCGPILPPPEPEPAGEEVYLSDRQRFELGIDALQAFDDPTLLLFPDAVRFWDLSKNTPDYLSLGQLQQYARKHCYKMQDRFLIADVIPDGSLYETAQTFRDQAGQEQLDYSAAYYPWIYSSYEYSFHYQELVFLDERNNLVSSSDLSSSGASGAAQRKLVADAVAANAEVLSLLTPLDQAGYWRNDAEKLDVVFYDLKTTPEKQLQLMQAVRGHLMGLSGSVSTRMQAILDEGLIRYNIPGLSADLSEPDAGKRIASAFRFAYQKLAALEQKVESQLFAGHPVLAEVKSAVQQQLRLLPPSGAMAGVYVATDASAGVWKAPANVSIKATLGPALPIDDRSQESLNVHETGKSLNVIRTFPGRGTVVWGARTLLANSLEWRYVPVRRLFIYAEEYLKKATEIFVFEPNDASTWLNLRFLIEQFLTGLWKQGALNGATRQEAYFVRVGIGETMSSQDVLEGRLIVEIGLAASRPAEFIVIRYACNMEES